MANKHFGNAGDVFKHLMLGELLRSVNVGSYLETHAGSAYYPLTEEPDRRLGWRQFRRQIDQFRYGAYGSLLLRSEQLGIYPGSALLSMRELPDAELYLFDTDPKSIVSLQTAALAHRQTRCILADGLAGALDTMAGLTFIDPFHPADGDPDSITVFQTLAEQDKPVVFWYPLLEPGQSAPTDAHENIYEVRFAEEHAEGLAGCGLLTANLGRLGDIAEVSMHQAYTAFISGWQEYLC